MRDQRFPRYTRHNPTRQFGELIAHYRTMHSEGYQAQRQEGAVAVAAEAVYPGDALPLWAPQILAEIRRHRSRTLLDYGSGKAAYFREAQRFPGPEGGDVSCTLGDYLDGIEVSTYEPALGDPLPERRVDCVVNADVLEHIHAGDVPWVIDEMFGLARHFVFCNIACYSASARLPNGEDAHITKRPPEYWRGMFDAVASRHAGVDFVLACSWGWGTDKSRLFRRGDHEATVGQGTYTVD